MYWTNMMKVTLKDAETAVAALEIMKTHLANGFECDKDYEWLTSTAMRDALNVVDNIITLPECFGVYYCEDLVKVIHELMQHLAENLSAEAFKFNTGYFCDCEETWVDGHYGNGELIIKTTYLPSGFGDCNCFECGEVIATMSDDAEGNVYIDGKLFTGEETSVCPECGEEGDLSDWLPIISEKTIKIL